MNQSGDRRNVAAELREFIRAVDGSLTECLMNFSVFGGLVLKCELWGCF